MTVKNEVKNHDEYDKLKFVEFLEFVCRMATCKYAEDTDDPFTSKLEKVLDEIFKAYDLKRNIGGEGEQENETSV